MSISDIIKVTKTAVNGEIIDSVNSREIYEYLEVDSKYNDWIKRVIERYDFTEGEDFTILRIENGKNVFLDYIVTLDMARELCMISSTPKGKEVRKYFIDIAKESNKPLSLMEQITLVAKGSVIQDERISKLERTKRLESWQEKSLQDAKNKKVYEIASENKKLANKLHRKVWSLFKKEFHLPRYNELPSIKYEDGLTFINELTIADMVY